MTMTSAAEANRRALVAQLYDEWHGYYLLKRLFMGVYVDVRPLDRAEAVTIRLAPDEVLEVMWNKEIKGNQRSMMDNETETRPEVATDEVLEYLDDLRDSGETNMFGAAPYLEASFGYDSTEARDALMYWMHTYGDRHA